VGQAGPLAGFMAAPAHATPTRHSEPGQAMSLVKAFQIEVTSATQGGRQVFFVEAESDEAALAALSRHAGLLPSPALKLQRRISDSEIDLHQIGPGSIVRWT
jgi:hypothetical protein